MTSLVRFAVENVILLGRQVRLEPSISINVTLFVTYMSFTVFVLYSYVSVPCKSRFCLNKPDEDWY